MRYMALGVTLYLAYYYFCNTVAPALVTNTNQPIVAGVRA